MRGAGASGARHKVSSVFVWCLPSVELRPFAVQWLARIPQYSVLRLVKRDPSVVCRLSSVVCRLSRLFGWRLQLSEESGHRHEQ